LIATAATARAIIPALSFLFSSDHQLYQGKFGAQPREVVRKDGHRDAVFLDQLHGYPYVYLFCVAVIGTA
jgi:hypothetical protein